MYNLLLMKYNQYHTLIFIFIVALLTFIVYRPVYNAPFLLDDHGVVEQAVIQESSMGANVLEWQRIKVMPRPIRYISLCFDHMIYGADPCGYHLTNIFLHFITVILLYFFLLSLGFSPIISAISSCLFLISPVSVTSVSVISDRKEILSFLFTLAGLFILHAKKWNFLKFILAAICFTLGVFSKEIVLVFPLLYLIIEYGDLKGKMLWYRFTGLSCLALVLFILSKYQIYLSMEWFGDPTEIDRPGFLPIGSSFMKAVDYSLWSFPQYLVKMISPFKHCVDPSIDFTIQTIYISIIGWVSYFGLLAYGLSKQKPIIWKSLLWIFIWLAFYICPFFIHNQSIQILNDRYAYQANLGIIILLSESIIILKKWCKI